ncbi:MFS transporter [Microlunatus speluncae]|uniref:MFS transporter n=1 Tax=Microlunatus speluncae TaxID=2594267 RepID=UPI00126670EE|nr:MFS transporter [Microlunatus speluncae]
MSSVVKLVAPLAARHARRADSMIFALNALIFAAWTPHIPAIKDRLGLHEGTLGLALLGAPVGALIAVFITGQALNRWGSVRVIRVTTAGFAAAAPLLGLADSLPTLFGALVIFGALQASMDVSMNTQAVTIEHRYGRPIMSSFHAIWAIGAAVGASLGSLALVLDVSLALQQAGLGVIVIIGMIILGRWLYPDDHVPEAEPGRGGGSRLSWISPRLIMIAAIMFAALLCEGAAADWAPLYLRDHVRAPEEIAGLAYTAFALAMFVGRAFGDRWVARFGGARVVAVLAAIGGAGLGIGLLAGQTAVVLAGLALYGLGIACIVPVCLSSAAAEAGRTGAPAGPALALADGTGRTGFLLGPTLIGGLAHVTALPLALGVLPIFCIGIVLASRALRPPKP